MNRKIINGLLLIALCFVLVGCTSEKNLIVGEWETKLGDNSYIYTFNEDKTCSYNASGTVLKCTYEINGDNISILYKGNTYPFETKYSIENNKLNIKDSFGNDTIYEKK